MLGISMASRRYAIMFVALWLITMVFLYRRSDSGESMETQELSRQLRRALDNLESLNKKNRQLQKEADSLRSAAVNEVDGKMDKINARVDEVKSKLDDAELSKEQCMEQVKNLESLISELRELQARGQEFIEGGKHGVIATVGSGPSFEHEMARFKLANNIKELWYFTKSQLKKMKNDGSSKMLSDIAERHRSIEVDLMTLSNSDSNADWREKEHSELQDLMQRRIHHLQNPKDCSTAKKLICDLNKGCGFGCQLHHAVYCFMVAYGTQRTMILQSKGWRYASKGWDSVFKPVSDTCTEVSAGQTRRNWAGEGQLSGLDVVVMPIVDALHNRPPYMPLSFPEDLAPRLQALHGDPSVWFIAQFVKYMMRPQQHLQDDLNEAKQKMNFKNPIVGIHVRRTDKVGTEAAFHGIDEYMEHVNEWFLLQERIPGKIDKRRVYIASDDASVLPEARNKYPNYEFFGDTSISQSAGMSSRYTDNSLRGVIIDIEMLAMTDYLVCTFSSQVCRVAYEIMQTLHPDASQWFHSLDDIYYFGGQGGHEETALYKHYPENRDEIALEPGDIVGIAGNHWDGYSKGSNKRTGGIGLYPSYKTSDKKVIVKYPEYPEVPLTET